MAYPRAISLVLLRLVLCTRQYSKIIKSVDVPFVSKTNVFALELYKEVISSEKGNVVISPFSISTCLSLAAMGAGGGTADEMFTVLKYDPAQKSSVAESYSNVMSNLDGNKSLKIANKMYIMENYTVKPNFNGIAQKSFRSDTESINFMKNIAAAQKINSWVEQKTNNKIKDLISPDTLNDYTRLVLVNAIHFKGTWTNQFNKERTSPKPFWISNTESVDTLMMRTKAHFKHGVFDDLGFAALELTYSDSDVSMLILLPNERDGLTKLEDNLQNIDITDLNANMHRQEVEVFMPKFKIEFNLELKDTLEKLGMGTMFSDTADFSELLEQNEPLKVSNVVHKAFIEVNEEGAEAAAATGLQIMAMCYLIPVEFIVNRPFYFAMISRTEKLILFNGNIQNPK